ncbi:MAG: TonB C-terminal domain-containing protein [Gammaproteobacteria bacterium]|nr:TonB C-terminal domain-containing protein [Gammaproteobacteria bacterium]
MTMPNNLKLLLVVALLLLSACASVPEEKLVANKCKEFVLSNEIIGCYKTQIQAIIKRKISTGTRHLTISDWPFEYAIRVDVGLNSQGEVQSVEMIKGSSSRQLNAKIMRTLQHIPKIPVPEKTLWEEGRFERLKLLFKPARSPIIGKEAPIPEDVLPILLPGPCATRSQQC